MGPEFPRGTVDTLARRAALRCSNPDCDCLTTGPNSQADKVTVIGEAAHIFGARETSARFRPEMSDQERRSISNGIWLCATCHTLVDKDPSAFPHDLLLAWRKEHEEKIIKQLGSRADNIKLAVTTKSMQKFAHLPPHVQQIIHDKPYCWEFILTAELLDLLLTKPLKRARDLERGLIIKRSRSLPLQDFISWASTIIGELLAAAQALGKILDEFQSAWGEPGQEGSADAIVHACELYANCADFFVEVSEEAMFLSSHAELKPLAHLISEGARHPLRNFPDLSTFARKLATSAEEGGTYVFDLVVDLPSGWEEGVEREMAIVERLLLQHTNSDL